LRTVLISQNAFGIQNSQNVIANEDTNKEAKTAYIQPIGLSRWSRPFPSGEGKGEGPLSLWTFVCSVLLCSSVRKKQLRDSLGSFFLTERTEFTESFGAHFEPTERLRHTENTEAFQLRLAVTFCDIGWLNVSVGLCVFCSSV